MVLLSQKKTNEHTRNTTEHIGYSSGNDGGISGHQDGYIFWCPLFSIVCINNFRYKLRSKLQAHNDISVPLSMG